jgi:ribonucleoside-diphosphate reductase alpha subunit
MTQAQLTAEKFQRNSEKFWGTCRYDYAAWGNPKNLVTEEYNRSQSLLMSTKRDEVLMKYYRTIQSSMWFTSEIQSLLLEDVHDWNNKLPHAAKSLLTSVLAFFKVGDNLVNENLVQNLMDNMPWEEASSFYAFQIAQESVHSETYRLLFDRIILENREQSGGSERTVLNSVNENTLTELITDKTEWIKRWLSISSEAKEEGLELLFPKKLIIMAIMEGVFFSASFALIYWVKSKNWMPSLTMSNNFIARDEGLHYEYTVMMFHKLYDLESYSNQIEWDAWLETTSVAEIFTSAYQVECKFWEKAFENLSDDDILDLDQMTLENIKMYVKYVLRGVCASLKVKCPMFRDATNPFDFMQLINMSTRTNFFERRSTEYSLLGLEGTAFVDESKDASTEESDTINYEPYCENKVLIEYMNDLEALILNRYPLPKQSKSLWNNKMARFVERLCKMNASPPHFEVEKTDVWLMCANDCALLSIFDYRFAYLAGLMVEVTCVEPSSFRQSRNAIEALYKTFRKRTNIPGECIVDNTLLHCENQEAFENELQRQQDHMLSTKMFEKIPKGLDAVFSQYGTCSLIVNKSMVTIDTRIPSYLAVKTLRESYLMKEREGDGVSTIYESIEFMYLRVAAACTDSPKELEQVFVGLLNGSFTFGSSILFNAGKKEASMSNCYLLEVGDSISEIMDSVKEMGVLSKATGGIGLHLTDVRSHGSPINSGQNFSRGILPLMQMINSQSLYINQGGKRQGSISVYLEPWHADIVEFLRCRLGHASAEEEGGRCRNLFTALWMPQIFFSRLQQGPHTKWTLFDPAIHPKCRQLLRTWGWEFEQIYEECERNADIPRKTVTCGFIWDAILKSLIETGTPYLLNKDTCNAMSQHKNHGCIRGSNLCAEIIQLSDVKTTAVCTLASVNLLHFADSFQKCLELQTVVCSLDERYNIEKIELIDLYKTVSNIVFSLNRILDKNKLPTEKSQRGNDQYGSLAIGVQGFAYLLQNLHLAFESPTTNYLNALIFEHLYIAACEASHKYQVKERNSLRYWFVNSPAYHGSLAPHLWEENQDLLKPRRDLGRSQHSSFYLHAALNNLRHNISLDGMSNSLLIALMPTASTSQILDNSESCEPLHSNVFKKQTLTGENVVVNRFLQRDLMKLNLWDEAIALEIERSGGSVQHIDRIPQELRQVYKTAWEIDPKCLALLAAQREPWIDQSQSRNVYIAGATHENVGQELLYAQSLGLKTIVYYLRTKPAREALRWADPKWYQSCVKSSSSCLACSS